MGRFHLAVLFVGTVTAFIACGTSEDDLRKADQARRDSLANALAQRGATADSNAATATDIPPEIDPSTLRFSETGRYAVQVGAWRSEENAERLTSVWKSRGFTHAFIDTLGSEETGDMWFRVRLGRMTSRSQADALVTHIQARHGLTAWIDILPSPKP